MKPFRARYIMQNELTDFGLPDPSQQSNIMAIVDSASSLIDEYCGRTDGHGNGTLVYTTYIERLLLQARNRNILRVSFKPLTVVLPSVASNLQASGNQVTTGRYQNFWTGVQANTVIRPDTSVSPMLGASGRYGYPRRGEGAIYPDLNYGMNLLQVAAFFGGPPGFTIIDPTAIDFDQDTGEIWLPAGLYLSQYTEIVAVYNSGYDPTNMPPAIKDACAALTRNLLARGGGTTGIKSISGQGMVNVTFTDDLIDTTIQNWLEKFRNIIAY